MQIEDIRDALDEIRCQEGGLLEARGDSSEALKAFQRAADTGMEEPMTCDATNHLLHELCHKRAISRDVLVRNGVLSVAWEAGYGAYRLGAMTSVRAELWRSEHFPALVFPYYRHTRLVPRSGALVDGLEAVAYAVKPLAPWEPECPTNKRRPSRYKRSPGRNYALLPVDVSMDDLADPALPMVVFEGEAKCLSAETIAVAGGRRWFIPVGVPGVGSWFWYDEHRRAVLQEELLAGVEAGKQLFIAFDSDRKHNSQVIRDEARFVDALRGHAARGVFRVELPDGDHSRGKTGMDDLMVRWRDLGANREARAERFGQLLAKAKEGDGV